jgi:hypothetical protein
MLSNEEGESGSRTLMALGANIPAMLTFRHASVGTSCLNVVKLSSRLMLPVMPREMN